VYFTYRMLWVERWPPLKLTIADYSYHLISNGMVVLGGMFDFRHPLERFHCKALASPRLYSACCLLCDISWCFTDLSHPYCGV